MFYKHQSVSDLAFILQAPLIYQDIDLSAFWLPDWPQKIAELDLAPEPLEASLAQCKSHFLGSYFESLFSFAINHFSSLDVVFEHQQLISSTRTLGEVDALVKDEQGGLHQLEVAIKFYLACPEQKGHWIGPNKNDSFDKKYQRAKSHQLTILDLTEANTLLESYGLNRPIQAHLCMFGILYQQINSAKGLEKYLGQVDFARANKGELINPESQRGYWIRLADLSLLAPYFDSAQELEKPFWITKPVQTESVNHFTHLASWHKNLAEKFEQDQRPRHFIINWLKNDLDKCYAPIFVVPNDW